ncbi:MAG TPA: NDP-sugar synthase [Armatimonadota bacterium]|nr:NDP-sugar synthase [Armatimonadota bacterium]
MKGLILAGGKSTRLYPLTLNIPKPMVPILNRPFLEHMIEWLRSHDIRDIVLTTGYLPHAIREHFKSGAGHGVKLEYVVEEEPLGTGGAIKNAEPLLGDAFFVFNGDILTGLDLREMARHHRRSGASVSISLTWVEDPTAYGVIETDACGRIVRFREKPAPDEVATHYINAGTYIFEPQALAEMPAGTRFSIERDFYPQALARAMHMHGYRDSSYWLDIGTAEKYLQAHRDMLTGKLECRETGRQVECGAWVGAETEISPEARITPPVLMGAGCVIAARARVGPHAVLGDGVRVGEGAAVADSVLWSHAAVGAEATVERSVVGSDVIIPAGARLVGEARAGQEQAAARAT